MWSVVKVLTEDSQAHDHIRRADEEWEANLQEVDDAAEKIAEAVKADSTESKEDVLNQPEPAQVPLPDTETGEKGAAL